MGLDSSMRKQNENEYWHEFVSIDDALLGYGGRDVLSGSHISWDG